MQSKDLLTLPKELGENLRLLRRVCEKTLDDVAAGSGLSKSFVGFVESGQRRIKSQDLRKLLAVYNYTLEWFLSKTQDTVEGFAFDAEAMVQTRNQSILLDGSRKDGEFSLVLLRPMRHEKDTEFIELYLPPETIMTKDFTRSGGTIRGYVCDGTLLIEMRDKEHIARQREEFCFDGRKDHIFRNFTQVPTRVLFTNTPM
jgi:transcriptional regulator with XRE-family HTH domain